MKSIIFDWSGTLANNFDRFQYVCSKIFEELKREPITKKEIRMNFTLPYMKFWNRYFPTLSKEKQYQLYEKYVHQADTPKLYPETRKTLGELHKKGCRMFVLSSDPLTTLIPETKELSGFFEKIVGDIYEKGEVIVELMEEFSLDKVNTYYVGDTSGDVEAGKYAGVNTIAISWGFQHKIPLSKSDPDFLIDKIEKILQIV